MVSVRKVHNTQSNSSHCRFYDEKLIFNTFTSLYISVSIIVGVVIPIIVILVLIIMMMVAVIARYWVHKRQNGAKNIPKESVDGAQMV